MTYLKKLLLRNPLVIDGDKIRPHHKYTDDLYTGGKNVMTDNDIIKALECCNETKASECSECPLLSVECSKYDLYKLALDLINRQKVEIERLTESGKEAVSCFTRMESLYKIKCKELEVAKSEAIKEFVSEFEKRCIAGGIYPAFVKKQLNDVKKEMVGE